MIRPAAAVSVLVALGGVTPMKAQVGGGSQCCERITPLVQAAELTAHAGEGRNQHQWMQAIVLWRTATPFRGSYSAEEMKEMERQRRIAEDAAEGKTRQHVGGVFAARYHYAETSEDRHLLWVGGREFQMPRRDSALVIMVDSLESPGGPTITTAYIRAEMPDGFWSTHWTSGDTSFSIRPRRRIPALAEALRASPIVASFLDAPARRP